jgi:hypothetical protein
MVFIYFRSKKETTLKPIFSIGISRVKKAFAAGFILILMMAPSAPALPPESVDLAPTPIKTLVSSNTAAQALPYAHVPVFEEKVTLAYQQYKKRPASELSKLIYLGDLLKQSDLVIIHAGQTYVPRTIAPLVTMYVRMNYKKETAKAWIAKHAYRNGPSYSMLYVKDAQGKLTLLRDFLLKELQSL